MIGAGSIVVKDIPDNSVAVVNPCKVIRSNTDDDNYTCLTNKHLHIYSENMCLWNRCMLLIKWLLTKKVKKFSEKIRKKLRLFLHFFNYVNILRAPI